MAATLHGPEQMVPSFGTSLLPGAQKRDRRLNGGGWGPGDSGRGSLERDS